MIEILCDTSHGLTPPVLNEIDRMTDALRDVCDDNKLVIVTAEQKRRTEQEELNQAIRERDEARQIARDLWTGLPTEVKVEIFDGRGGWLPEWIRPSSN